MKTEMYEFDGALYRQNDVVTLNFNVALNNISNFLAIVPKKSKSINKCVEIYNGSSGQYKGKRVTVKCDAWVMYCIFLKLGCRENSEVRNNVHVNYSHLANLRQKSLPMVLIWSPSKGYYTQFRSRQVDYKSIYTQGSKERRHIIKIN